MTTRPTSSVRIDSEVLRALRVLADREGTTTKAIIERALHGHYRHLYPAKLKRRPDVAAARPAG